MAGKAGRATTPKVINPVTSPKEASKAARVLNDPNATKLEKSLAGATLVNARHKGNKKR